MPTRVGCDRGTPAVTVPESPQVLVGSARGCRAGCPFLSTLGCPVHGSWGTRSWGAPILGIWGCPKPRAGWGGSVQLPGGDALGLVPGAGAQLEGVGGSLAAVGGFGELLGALAAGSKAEGAQSTRLLGTEHTLGTQSARCHAVPCRAKLCHAKLCRVVLCHNVLCRAELCRAKLCRAVPSCAEPCQASPGHAGGGRAGDLAAASLSAARSSPEGISASPSPAPQRKSFEYFSKRLSKGGGRRARGRERQLPSATPGGPETPLAPLSPCSPSGLGPRCAQFPPLPPRTRM